MEKKLWRKIVWITILVPLLAGCKEAPEPGDQGTGMAEGKTDQAVEGIVQGSEASEWNVEGDQLDCTIGTGEKSLQISATVQGRQIEEAPVGSILTLPAEMIAQEDVIQAFFGGDSSQVQEDAALDEELQNLSEQAEETVETKGFSENKGSYSLVSSDQNQKITVNMAGFDYFDLKLQQECGSIYAETQRPAEEDSEFTLSDASELLEKAFSELGISDILVKEGICYQDSSNQVYYEIYFAPAIDGLPIASANCSGDDVLGYSGKAEICKEGIADINFSNGFLQTAKEGETQKLLSLDQELQVLQEYVDAGEIVADSDVSYKKIELEYFPGMNGNQVELYPVWHFYIPANDFLYEMDDQTVQSFYEKGASAGIYLSAVDGRIIGLE